MATTNSDHLSRRAFLRASAVAAAAATTAGEAHAARQPIAGTVRVGLVGYGARGREIAASIADDSQIALTAIADIYTPHKERAQNETRAKVLHDWQALVGRNDIDAIVVATPDHLHASVANAALSSGKHVLCEAPMCRTLDEARSMRDTTRDSSSTLSFHVSQVGAPAWAKAAELLHQGIIGAPRWVQSAHLRAQVQGEPRVSSAAAVQPGALDWAAFHGSAPSMSFDAQRFANWRNFTDYSAGAPTQVLFERLAPVIALLDLEHPERVSAAGGIYAKDGRQSPDSFVMNMEYAGGLKVVLSTAMDRVANAPTVVRGESGSMHIGENEVSVVYDRQRDGRASEVFAVESPAPMLTRWFDSIAGQSSALCDSELAFKTMATLCMGIQAYEHRRTFAWDTTRDCPAIATLRA